MKIETLVEMAPVFTALLGTYDPESTFIIADLERYIYATDRMGLGIEAGDEFQESSMTHRVLTDGQPFKVSVDAEQSPFGKEYTCVSIPIYDGDEICGAISWGVGTQQIRLNRMAENLHGLSKQVSDSTSDYANHASSLSNIQGQLVKQIEALVAQTQTIRNVNKLITDLAARTKIIGLNASIEAARVGEEGRGFAVVAKEIRTLAEQSQHATVEITENMQQITGRIEEAFAFCRQISETSEQQASGAKALSSAIQEVKGLAQALKEMAFDRDLATA